MSARFLLLPLLLGCYEDTYSFDEDEDGSLCGGQEGSPDGYGPCEEPGDPGETEADPLADLDEDGVAAAEDCDDGDPSVWMEGKLQGDLEGRDVLGFCHGYCRRDIGGNLEVQSTALDDLNGLRCVEEIDGWAVIERNPSLASLAGLVRLRSVGGELIVQGNPSLADISALSSLAAVGDLLGVVDNPALASLAGLEGMVAAENVVIKGNTALTDLSGLANLTEAGNLWIEEQPGLADLSGLESLATFTSRGLILHENAGLTSLAGLDSLSPGEHPFGLYISSAPALTSLEALAGYAGPLLILQLADVPLASLAGLEGVTEIGEIQLYDNPALADLSALAPALADDASLGGSLLLHDNDALADLSVFSGLTEIDGALEIVGNAALTDLSGLAGLASVSNELVIQENDGLTSLSALHNLAWVGSAISVCANDALPASELDALGGVLAEFGGAILECE